MAVSEFSEEDEDASWFAAFVEQALNGSKKQMTTDARMIRGELDIIRVLSFDIGALVQRVDS